MLLFGIVFLSLGSVNNMLAERFHLDDNGIGTLTALLPFGILAGSLIFGPIVDRFGYRWMLIICALLVMAGWRAWPSPIARALSNFSSLIGFGGGVLNGATNALAADVSEGERGAKLSLLGVFFGLGALGMPSTLAALCKHFSLAGIVAGIGGFVLVPVIYFLVITFPPPKQKAQPASATSGLASSSIPSSCWRAWPGDPERHGSMSNDWITATSRKLRSPASTPAEWQTLLGLMAVTGAMVLARVVLSGLLKRIKSQAVLFASIGITAAAHCC